MQFLLYTKTLEKLHSHKKIPGKVLKFCSYQNGRNLVFVLPFGLYRMENNNCTANTNKYV